jgi:hypothetical protein
MSWVGFEPTIPAFERAKTFHALDRAATVIGYSYYWLFKIKVWVCDDIEWHNVHTKFNKNRSFGYKAKREEHRPRHKT